IQTRGRRAVRSLTEFLMMMKSDEQMTDTASAQQNHQTDAFPSFSIDPRRKADLLEPDRSRTANYQPSDVDAGRLAAELREQIRGEVRFDNGSRALYATDAS